MKTTCIQYVKDEDTLNMSKAEWIDELKSVFAKAKKEQRAIFPNVVMFIQHLLQQERDRVIEEVEKLEKDLNEYTQGATQPCYGVAIEDLSTLKKRNKEC